MKTLPVLYLVLCCLLVLTESALTIKNPKKRVQSKLIIKKPHVAVGHPIRMKGIRLNKPGYNSKINQNRKRIKRSILPQGYPQMNMVQEQKSGNVTNNGGTCCNSFMCYPCPSNGGGMMMPYPQMPPQMVPPPMTVYPGSMVYQPVEHHHPHPRKVMAMMKRDRKRRRHHKHKHRYSDSDDDDSSDGSDSRY
ncbi:unnamed protein product [Plutella xylostella]|uniref:(diamondback moth) hypothetical protein n=1 Tax=Plutella xylostella TaxID=51655 RepID=A0A8S4F1I0_PLUXY|nr:unnamed protein product [Plutella xylostella]